MSWLVGWLAGRYFGRSVGPHICAMVEVDEGWLVGCRLGSAAGAESVVREGETNKSHANVVWFAGLGGWHIGLLMVHEYSVGGMIGL